MIRACTQGECDLLLKLCWCRAAALGLRTHSGKQQTLSQLQSWLELHSCAVCHTPEGKGLASAAAAQQQNQELSSKAYAQALQVR